MEYVNRRGERYYLLEGKTKTGKPKYYASRKPGGVPVERMPEGYEVYEHPERGLVSVRKIRPSKVLPVERERLTRWVRELAGMEYFCVDLQEDSLVIYTPATDPAAAVSALGRIFGSLGDETASHQEWIGKNTHYLPMLRFTLVDEKKRTYSAERWCFRGSVNAWLILAGGQPLETLAKKFLPHLNKESFFELF